MSGITGVIPVWSQSRSPQPMKKRPLFGWDLQVGKENICAFQRFTKSGIYCQCIWTYCQNISHEYISTFWFMSFAKFKNWGRGGIFYHFMANTLATQDLLQNGQDFTAFTTWAQIKVERCVWNTRRGMGGGEVNCWIMLTLEGQGCSYSALGCEHQEHTEKEGGSQTIRSSQ